ncbi:MAG: hypothetical protein A2X86_13880 [Bdellovibrionales bacterium GWA2_49_15]|nr:MAG: hypothetical protein A2X86_13880 [Bdellovibrionales bacterium GWA2_49_15]HAZ13618.1 hypothetical protein [Bdellovibrionales bacterium]
MNRASFFHLFDPLTYIYIYIFLIITTIHLQITALSNLPMEIGCVVSAVVLAIIDEIFFHKARIMHVSAFLKALMLALLAIILPLLSSIANNDYLGVIMEGEYRSYCKIILLSPLIIYYIKTTQRHEQLIKVVLFSFTVLGVIFLYRYKILHEVREYDLRPLLRIKNGDPNFLSMYFTLCIPLAGFEYRNAKKLAMRLVYVVILLLFFVCTVMNQSRMGIIALFITSAIMMIFLKWRLRLQNILLGFVVICMTLIFSSGGEILTRFNHMADTSNLDRLKTLKAGVKTFIEYPFAGVGWNNSSAHYYTFSQYPPFQSEAAPYEVHNTFLKIASELGILGFFLYTTFLGIIVIAILETWKEDRERAVVNSAMLACLFVNALTISAAYKDIYILLMILIFALNGPKKTIGILDNKTLSVLAT